MKFPPQFEEVPIDLGTCCVCGTPHGVNEIILIEKLSPIAGKGWGCLECGLSEDGAVAVVCEACGSQIAAGQAKLRYVCSGRPATDGRTPIGELIGTHKHNMSKHLDRDGGF